MRAFSLAPAPKYKWRFGMMNYRVSFVLSLIRIFFLPPIVVSFVLHLFPGVAPLPLSSMISIPLCFTLQQLWISHQRSCAARRVGALPIPVVRGKWPGNLDILKNLLDGWKNGYINDTLRGLFIQYQSPTINIRILWVDQIWTMDPNHMKHILVSGFRNFDKGVPQRERMKGFLGTGIFASDGEMWRIHRTMAHRFLSKSVTSDVHLFTRHTQGLFAQLDMFLSTAGAFDIQELAQNYTLNIALDSLFGYRSGRIPCDSSSIQGTESKTETLAVRTLDTEDCDLSTDHAAIIAATRAMDKAAEVTVLRARQGVLWPLIEFRTDKQKEPARIMRRWIDAVIRQTRKNSEKLGSDSETFLEQLVQSTKDQSIIRDQLINMVFGSRDTTVAFITFTIYFLALHPEVYEKLRIEVMGLCPLDGSIPESHQIEKFIYLRAILNETQRLFPSVPINTRYSTSESILPPAVWLPITDRKSLTPMLPPYYTQPLYMPPRTSMSMLTLLMQRRADLWGADAENFRPSRWLPPEQGGDGVSEAGGPGKRPEWFVPFSAGPRVCPGRNIAYAEVTYLLIGLVQRGYVFTLAPEQQPRFTRPPEAWKTSLPVVDPVGRQVFVENGRQSEEQCWPCAAFTLYSKGGLWMNVSKIQDQESNSDIFHGRQGRF